MGGSSKSSSSSDQSQSSVSADGVVTGKVFQVDGGSTLTYTDELPAPVVDIFKELIGAATGAGELAAKAYDSSLASTQAFAKDAVQPDVALTKQITGYVPIAIVSALVLVGIVLIKR